MQSFFWYLDDDLLPDHYTRLNDAEKEALIISILVYLLSDNEDRMAALFRQVISMMQPGQIWTLLPRLQPPLRDLYRQVADLKGPLALQPNRVSQALAIREGVGIGPLYLYDRPLNDAQALTIPEGAVVASDHLAGLNNGGPYAAILTFVNEGEISHAEKLARLWDIPHALVPGPDSFRALAGKIVRVTVHQGHVSIVEATQEEWDAWRASRPPRPAPNSLKLPPVDLAVPEDFLPPGHPNLKRPEVVGHKIADMNQLQSLDLDSGDPRIEVRIAPNAAIPFSALMRSISLSERDEYQRSVHSLTSGLDSVNARDELSTITEIMIRAAEKLISSLTKASWYKESWLNQWIDQGIFVRMVSNSEGIPEAPELAGGTYLTVANVVGPAPFLEAICEAVGSLRMLKSYRERQRHGVDESTLFGAVGLVPSQPANYSCMIRTTAGSVHGPGKMLVEVAQGWGNPWRAAIRFFAGRPTQIVVDKATLSVDSSDASEKKWQLVQGAGGGTLIVPTEEAKEFLKHPDHSRLIAALARIGVYIESICGPQEIELVLKADPSRRSYWTIIILQTRLSADIHLVIRWDVQTCASKRRLKARDPFV